MSFFSSPPALTRLTFGAGKVGSPADWNENLPPAFAPSGRILKPAEIAHFALAFVSDEGGPVSGAITLLLQMVGLDTIFLNFDNEFERGGRVTHYQVLPFEALLF